MAAIENKELTHSSNGNGAARAAAKVVQKKAQLSLVKPGAQTQAAGAQRALPPARVETPAAVEDESGARGLADRKSTRLNSSHANISYAVFCLKKKIKRSTALHSTPLNLTYLSSS